MHNWSVPFNASYEVDLWGRLRGDAEIGRQNVLQADADRAAVRLRVATDVASDYLTLHFVEQDLATLARAIELRRTALDVIAARVRAGAVPVVLICVCGAARGVLCRRSHGRSNRRDDR